MILWNIKSIIKSKNFKIAFITILAIFSLLQLLASFKYTGIHTGSIFENHVFIAGNISLNLIFSSFIIPLLIIMVGTYDDVYNDEYVEQFVKQRMGESKYLRSRTLAIGIVTFSMFLVISLLLLFMTVMISCLYEDPYEVSEMITVVMTKQELSLIVLTSSIIMPVIYSLISMGIFLLSNIISLQKKITTLIVIQLVILSFHVLLYISGILFEYTSFVVDHPYSTRGSSLIGRALFFDKGAYYMAEFSDKPFLFNAHVTSSIIIALITALAYFILPLVIVKVKTIYLDYNNSSKNNRKDIRPSKFNGYKIKSYLTYILPSFLFIIIYSILIRFVDFDLNIGDIFNVWFDKVVYVSNKDGFISLLLEVWLIIPLIVYFIFIAYQIITSTERYYSEQRISIMVRYKSRDKYYFDVLLLSVKISLIHFTVFLISSILFFPPLRYSYSGFIVTFLSFGLSFVTFAILISLFRNIFNSYLTFVYILITIVITFVIVAIMGSEVIPDVLYKYNHKFVTGLTSGITMISNFSLIGYIDLIEEISKGSKVMYMSIVLLVQIIQILLLSFTYMKVGKQRDKEYR